MKKALLIAVVVIATAPFTSFAQTCDTSGNAFMRFLWPCGTGPGNMKEVMTVSTWGPINAPSYHGGTGGQNYVSYPQMPQLGTQYQYPQNSYPSYQQPTYYQQPQYAYPQYQYGYPQQYQYPQYSQPQYSYPQGGGLHQPTVMPPSPTQMMGIQPRPVGGHDIWGDPLCNWGSGYYGYSCYQDPHQWIFDSYTGQWY